MGLEVSVGRSSFSQIPSWMKEDKRFTIAHLELVAIMVAIKLWFEQLHGKRLKV